MSRPERLMQTLVVVSAALLLGGSVDTARGRQCEANELAKLLDPNGVPGEEFGWSVAIDGDIAVVGAYLDAGGGSAFVFGWDGSTWSELAKLTASDAQGGDGFGIAVAVSGDTIVIGAYYDDAQAGSAYVFVWNGSTWVQVARLVACDRAAGDMFGWDVGISGETILVGALHDDGSAGSAYVFEKGTGWVDECTNQVARLRGCDTEGGDLFGASAAIYGDSVVIGAPSHDGGRGAAYVFEKDAGWVDGCANQAAKLTASDADTGAQFGNDVAICDGTVLVGALNVDPAYVFVKPTGGWINMTETAQLTASDGGASDYFGESVAISGDIALVGAKFNGAGGAAYAFVKPPGGWIDMTETAKLTASDGGGGFGCSLGMDAGIAVIGAHNHDSNTGSAYAFHGLSDCNANDVLDICDIANDRSTDDNANGIPDECEDCPNPGDSGNYCIADCYPNNGDGVWDDSVDGDCIVDLSDLGQLLANYGCTSGCTREDGDVFPPGVGDGWVQISDLGEMLAQYNDHCN